ncbi:MULTISPECIES: FAD-binding oxidoreductase [unclassified Pseudomonas]|uniref:NAD(P)/FAD-dependent oxidoreductase n=1 Tax=unclassified Pseudomonas TaxID=196821 RepID=UPI001295FADE|nr:MULTISPECIES: FAD-dependent oxidoreductase [unclassified Pseudomonas]MQT41636.1 FAD-dependent oxidoreductase [Pseudomonas sp. FSL R10-0765]MQT52316.1 FAD-dependent oxidoreductase [Pseudomonas sp. FSL R10-2398]MQU03130.1 FAD-dependent oxidoreductase [Pseudomonas sp. FSL R10-2245]MQU13459.1 FAD-dependent oxidoreductase [Pseudomonas sp. FSL R10-2189]MQU38130.1 FAD-dependent oxidoreductase [Pseudomonas sp. FSL R10-2172]
MASVISTDVLIVGAGVAGLWLNARLRRQGFSTVLVENHSLGGAQTLKSQGIIHGGAKYALHGALTGASEAIADMPRRWREALAGEGELDLSGVRLLSDAHYLWSPGTLAGNLTSFFASKAVRGRVDQVKGDQLPPALQDPRFKGKVYRLAELVVDVPSLVERLAELAGDSLLAGQKVEPLFENERLIGLRVDGLDILAQRIVLSAGQGNAELLTSLEINVPAQQLRPLHMVMVKGPSLKPLYAHCLGGGPKPRITVTTHPAANGEWVWYVGGDIAEAEGVARTPDEQIAAAKKELASLLPWVDLSQAQWATLRVDRAEPAQSGLVRPDNAFVSDTGRLLVGWPTKLALAPDFSDRVINALEQDGIKPGNVPALPDFPRPPLGKTAWEQLLP